MGRTVCFLAHGKGVDMIIESSVSCYITAEFKRQGRLVEEVEGILDTDGVAVIQLVVCSYRILEIG